MLKTILACLLSFAVSLLAGRRLIPWLRRLKAGQEIREDGPTWHNSKAGTPTMGGLMFIAGILIAISMLLTLLAGLIPSGAARRKDPVAALRTE